MISKQFENISLFNLSMTFTFMKATYIALNVFYKGNQS